MAARYSRRGGHSRRPRSGRRRRAPKGRSVVPAKQVMNPAPQHSRPIHTHPCPGFSPPFSFAVHRIPCNAFIAVHFNSPPLLHILTSSVRSCSVHALVTYLPAQSVASLFFLPTSVNWQCHVVFKASLKPSFPRYIVVGSFDLFFPCVRRNLSVRKVFPRSRR